MHGNCFTLFYFVVSILFSKPTHQNIFQNKSSLARNTPKDFSYVEHSSFISRLITGRVLDAITLLSIQNALVIVDEVHTTTNESGAFALPSIKKVFVDVRIVLKKKYKSFEKFNVYLSGKKPNKFIFHLEPMSNTRDYSIGVLFKKMDEFIVKRAQNFTDPSTLKHLNHEEMHKILEKMVKRCSDIMHLSSIGESVEGRKMWVVQVGNKPAEHQPGWNSVILFFINFFHNSVNSWLF